MKVKVKSLSRVRPSTTPWTAAHQAPPSMGIFQARVLEWVAIAFSSQELVALKQFLNVECLTLALFFFFFTLWEKLIEPFLAESQKKKQQDDSDEYDDDDSAASTSFQPQPVQPQQGYIPPMAQPGLPPVPGAPGMPPGST